MSAHTPGEWVADLGEAYRVRSKQDGGQVAIMMNLKGAHGLAGRRTGGEVAANARLIAAAPELLQALIDILEESHDLGAVECAKAAIAKAAGSAA